MDDVLEGLVTSVNDIETSNWHNDTEYVTASLEEDFEQATYEEHTHSLVTSKRLMMAMLGVVMVMALVIAGAFTYSFYSTSPSDEDMKEIATVTFLPDNSMEVEIPFSNQ